MSLLDYINEVLWGRLGRLCAGLVFFFSAVFAAYCALNITGIPITIYALILLGPSVLYQTITFALASLLWLSTKDWGDNDDFIM